MYATANTVRTGLNPRDAGLRTWSTSSRCRSTAVRGAGVGPWDVAIISGAFGQPALPYIPGIEVAGVVEAVGDVADVQPGDRVYANLGLAGGGFAEYALADADRLARVAGRQTRGKIVLQIR
jgi:hypothetical protein